MALSWLVDCGQAYKVFRVSKPAFPLKAYEDMSAFKMFLVDIGLMSAMADLDAKTLLEGNVIFNEFKGALTEQFVFQQLVSDEDLAVHYWSAERSTAEVDFIIQHNGRVVPIEVKAEENLKAKSLKVFMEKFNPGIAIRMSMSDFRNQDRLINLPLYAVSKLKGLLNQ
jgi:predicted AAA+ superfamily ATPase